MSMSERVAMWVAWRLPRVVVMWCAVRVMAHATQGQYSNQIVPDLGAMEALNRWTAPEAQNDDAPLTIAP